MESNIIATMSHELRTPLNSVIGFSELLQDDNLSESDRRAYLKAIHGSGVTLLNLINDLLDYSKLESGAVPLNYEPVDVGALCRECVGMFIPLAGEKNLALKVNFATGLPILRCDALRLRQILINLLGNAVKFTASGFVELEVEFQPGSSRSGKLTLRVRDSGVGVRDEFKKRIFRPFVQVPEAATRGEPGTGLGLSITAKLVERMRGSIELESVFGEGSCFSVNLPDLRIGKVEKRPPVTSVANAWPGGAPVVVAVDDVGVNLTVLLVMLRKLEVAASGVGSGAEALSLLRRKHCDVLMTDLRMPGMSGEELLQQVRADPAFKRIKVIAVTAGSEVPPGFDAVILKPLTLERVRQTLCGLIKKE